MNRPHERRGGFTLAEMLVYIVVLGAVVGVAWLAHYRFLDHSFGVLRNVEDITRVVRAGEKWRAEVRRATAPPRLDGGVLHVPTAEGEVLFRFAGGAVQRKTPGAADWAPYLLKVKASRMELDRRGQVDSWRWEVELDSRRDAQIRPLFTFRCVPRPGTRE